MAIRLLLMQPRVYPAALSLLLRLQVGRVGNLACAPCKHHRKTTQARLLALPLVVVLAPSERLKVKMNNDESRDHCRRFRAADSRQDRYEFTFPDGRTE